MALDSSRGADLTPALAAGNVSPVAVTSTVTATGGPGRRRFGRSGIHGRQGIAGWAFIAPAIALLVIFLVIPIVMAFWVSLTNWSGIGSPFKSGVPYVGTQNYRDLFASDTLAREDLMTSLRNTFYFVLFVVPIQTSLALFLALVVNQRMLKGKSFFRISFYFPSVTSSVAISTVFLFLFTGGGAINAILKKIGITGPQWFQDSSGLFQVILSKLGIVKLDSPPSALANHGVLSLSWWDWFSGPSVAMCAIIILVIWTTSGTFMLMFLAALQDLPVDVEEASLLDGAGRWQRLRLVTLPQIKPVLFLVLTLGLIGTWQVFDQIFITTQGGPDKTTSSPAYLSYSAGFQDHNWGSAAAISFVLFAIITLLTGVQRYVLRDKDAALERRQARTARKDRMRANRSHAEASS
jgi:multiple sugar transport system permease protein